MVAWAGVIGLWHTHMFPRFFKEDSSRINSSSPATSVAQSAPENNGPSKPWFLDDEGEERGEAPAEPELGVIYNGTVVKTVDFGAFVNFLGAKDGLVHISELQNGRTEKTTDICKEGDMVKVKVIGFDDRGKVKLSMKRVDQETGADLESEAVEE